MIKFIISIPVAAGIIAISVYSDAFKKLPILVQIILIFILASLQLIITYIYDIVVIKKQNFQLQQEKVKLESDSLKTKVELNEFQNVIAKFIEYSDVYRQRVKDYLKLSDDYLCIIKSSEGLSDVFNEMEEKEMLPFGRVLINIPGTVKPFERISLFLIPLTSLPGLNYSNIREYISKKIIPKVEKEREVFLKKVPSRISKKAEPLSYKYVAFLLKKDSITYDLRNRKFNHDFYSFIVGEQSKENMSRLKKDLSEVIKIKEFFLIVNWSSFIELNKEQKSLIEKYQQQINSALESIGIANLSDLSKASSSEIQKIIKSVLKSKISPLKALNLAKKIVNGTNKTLGVLRKNGIKV